MNELDLDAARSETTADIAGCLHRLSRASKFLTLAQRVALAEIARDLGDALDEGRSLSPRDKTPRQRFIKSEHVDEKGRPLFRQMNNW
jgi:hypothetical protein